MDWIKSNFEKCLLALAALILLVLSGLLIFQVVTFQQVFKSVTDEVPHNPKIKIVEAAEIERAHAQIKEPAKWLDFMLDPERGFLLVSRQLIVRGDQLYDPRDAGMDLYPPIKNEWFYKYKLDILDTTILSQDTDQDGFTNKEEAAADTDPTDKNSHPPYTNKLRLKQWIHVTLPFIFKSYDSDEYQINPLNGRGSQFLKKGAQIAGTTYTITDFKELKTTNANGIEKDVSELKIVDSVSKKEVTMIRDKRVESPFSIALFHYLIEDKDLHVTIDQIFSLPQEPDKKYKLLSIDDKEATIQNEKTKELIKVPHL